MSKLDKMKALEIYSAPHNFTKLQYRGLPKRRTTEEWLKEVNEREGIEFKYFLTLSFYKAQKSIINQYLDNNHIKKVLLDFFYPNRKPIDRIRFWFFVERHADDYLHLHILMEGIDGIEWLSKRNRKITIKKTTILEIINGNYSIEEVMIEAVTHHLQEFVLRLGKGRQGVDMRKVGDVKKRIQYVNKSLDSLDFNGWEHIDWENSDLKAMHIKSIQRA
jgi:hypothetical protein